MNEQMKMLAEAYNYKGVFFVENYVFSNLLKAFYEDTKIFGKESAEDMYVTLFGEEAEEVFRYLNKNYSYLKEAATIKSQLLFEGYAEKTLNEGIGKVASFLKGAWDKLKGIGTGALKNLKDFVGKGIPWAKEIAQKGVSFFASNPIAQVAVPAVALAGGAAAGWKLIKKMKGNKASKEEYKKALEQKKGQAKKYVKGDDVSFEEEVDIEEEENLNEVVGVENTKVSVKDIKKGNYKMLQGNASKVELNISFDVNLEGTDEDIKEQMTNDYFVSKLEKFLEKNL